MDSTPASNAIVPGLFPATSDPATLGLRPESANEPAANLLQGINSQRALTAAPAESDFAATVQKMIAAIQTDHDSAPEAVLGSTEQPVIIQPVDGPPLPIDGSREVLAANKPVVQDVEPPRLLPDSATVPVSQLLAPHVDEESDVPVAGASAAEAPAQSNENNEIESDEHLHCGFCVVLFPTDHLLPVTGPQESIEPASHSPANSQATELPALADTASSTTAASTTAAAASTTAASTTAFAQNSVEIMSDPLAITEVETATGSEDGLMEAAAAAPLPSETPIADELVPVNLGENPTANTNFENFSADQPVAHSASVVPLDKTRFPGTATTATQMPEESEPDYQPEARLQSALPEKDASVFPIERLGSGDAERVADAALTEPQTPTIFQAPPESQGRTTTVVNQQAPGLPNAEPPLDVAAVQMNEMSPDEVNNGTIQPPAEPKHLSLPDPGNHNKDSQPAAILPETEIGEFEFVAVESAQQKPEPNSPASENEIVDGPSSMAVPGAELSTHIPATPQDDPAVEPISATTAELPEILQEEILAADMPEGELKEIQIRFDPPKLGQVRLLVSRADDEINVRLLAVSPLSLEVIEHDLPAIRDAIDQAGIQLGEFHLEQESSRQSQTEQHARPTVFRSETAATDAEQADNPPNESNADHIINVVA